MNDAPIVPNDQRSVESSNDLALSSLTDKNWLFIKHFLDTGNIEKAYVLAGYEGNAPSTKYDLFKKLKPFIEEIGNMAVTSRLRLVADLSKALALPLSSDKVTVSISEWLRLRKFAATLTPEVSTAPRMSVLVVNRYSDKGTQAIVGDVRNTPSSPIIPSDVIDLTPIE